MSGGYGNPAITMSKKESFQIYLEKTGVIDALTKGSPRLVRRPPDHLSAVVLLRCFEEPVLPDSPLDFIKSYLGVPTAKDDAATNKVTHPPRICLPDCVLLLRKSLTTQRK